MTIHGKAYIAGAYEHPTRKALDKSLAQLHADVEPEQGGDEPIERKIDLGEYSGEAEPVNQAERERDPELAERGRLLDNALDEVELHRDAIGHLLGGE